MKFARLSALSAAMVLASAAQANAFAPLIEDGSLDLHLRNYFKKDTTKNANDVSDHQWAQAFSLNYSSGYLGNIIGFDLGGHYSLKLKASTDDGNPGLLPVDSNGSSSSYGKTTYAVKLNLMDYGEAKYGRMFLDTPLLADNYSRSLPSLTEAFYADGTFGDLDLYGIWALKANHRTESGFDYLMLSDGTKEAVKVLGGGYNFRNGLNGLTTHLAVAQQDDYARRYYVDAGYSMDMDSATLTGDFVFGHNARIGKEKAASGDNSQNTWALSVGAEVYNATFGVSYQAVSQTDIGAYQTEWAGQSQDQGDMTGYFGPHDMMINSFSGNGQKSWGLNLGYDFADMVDGLSFGAMFAKGKVDEKDGSAENDKDESEYNLKVTYATPQVENLSLAALYGKNTVKDKVDGSKTTKTQIRFIVKYDMSVF